MKKICVIGGGAAGMTAAITAARKGLNVTIIEHMPRLGKKLLLTGSGKCNLTNIAMSPSHFHSSNNSFMDNLFEIIGFDEVLSFLKSLGIEPKDRNGYIYPYCEQASAVLDCFRFTIRDLGINVLTETKIQQIQPPNQKSNRFLVKTKQEELYFDKLIICCGSKSYSKTGSDGSGYTLAKSFGHSIINPLPALTYFVCKESFYPGIAGIRTKAKVSFYRDNGIIISDIGELQITKTGISGIPVFNISYAVSKMLENQDSVKCLVDFLPDMSSAEAIAYLNAIKTNHSKRTLEEAFSGYLHKNLGICIIKLAGLRPSSALSDLTDKDISKIINMAKSFSTIVTATGDFESCQVCSGGINIDEISMNMESKIQKGLYFAGEILDVNGDCGGYNLHFAFASGIIAGRSCIND